MGDPKDLPASSETGAADIIVTRDEAAERLAGQHNLSREEAAALRTVVALYDLIEAADSTALGGPDDE